MHYKIQLIMPTSMGIMKDDFPVLLGEKDTEPTREDIIKYIVRAGYHPDRVRWNVLRLDEDKWNPIGLEDNNLGGELRTAGQI